MKPAFSFIISNYNTGVCICLCISSLIKSFQELTQTLQNEETQQALLKESSSLKAKLVKDN